ncbi:MAG: ion transporter [Rhodobacteraceae bacterium]|nr:ion transporter [Paracoccaceae bacterium]
MIKRTEIPEIIDGTHPTAGRTIALIHQGLIVLSAIAISVETVPNLPIAAQYALSYFEFTVLALFLLEYIIRIVCAVRPLHYILSFWGVVDLLSCVPILLFLNPHWVGIRIIRVMRLMRILKLMHTNRALIRLELALEKSRGELTVFAFLALSMLYIAAIGIYIFEHDAQPDKFSSIPMALWWAIVSFTTVGYGDMYPITAGGRIFTALMLFVGLGVIAVPAAIITSALIHTDVEEKIAREVEEELRDDLAPAVRKNLSALKRKPKRRL